MVEYNLIGGTRAGQHIQVKASKLQIVMEKKDQRGFFKKLVEGKVAPEFETYTKRVFKNLEDESRLSIFAVTDMKYHEVLEHLNKEEVIYG